MPKYNKQKRFCIKSHGPSFTLLAYWAPMTSNLPLDLKSITYVSDPHQTPVTLKDNLRQRLLSVDLQCYLRMELFPLLHLLEP